MKLDVEAAKKAGYTESEIKDFLSKNSPKKESSKQFDVDAAKSAGYSDKEIQGFLKKNDISKARSVISAPVKGVLKGVEDLGQLANPLPLLVKHLMGQNHPQREHLAEQLLPTRDEALENYLERAGKIAPGAALGGGFLSTLLSSLGGAAFGEVAKEQGIGETGQGVAEAVGMGVPGFAKAASKGITNLFRSPVEKFSSGITKPRALGAKFAEKTVISPSRQEKAISALNKEASELTKKTVQKELPISKKIEQGFDFEGNFEKRFGGLEKVAEKANPEIDLTPVSEFLSESSKKYRGIPKLHPEGAKVKAEINAFRNAPQTEMKKLLRIYRSNNKKIRNIYETSRLTGKQQEYVDFLVDYNRNIAKSFEKTLPKDSAWVKEFKGLNHEYKQYKDALKTMNQLEGVLNQKATPGNISKLADDARLHKKLALSMGEKGSKEVIQIAKDLKLASEAIRRIPARDFKWYESVLPFSFFIPGAKIPGSIYSAKKGLDYARRGYGWFLSTSKRRAVYNDLLKGLADDNRVQYAKAAKEMAKLLEEEKED
jgi:hypothetical protein